MIKRFGSEEAWRKYMREIGKQGGEAPHSKPRGFATNRELASRAGVIGGRIGGRARPKRKAHEALLASQDE